MPSVTPDDRGEEKSREQAEHGLEHVMRQDAPDGQVDEGLGDRDQRGEQLRREHPGLRHDLPQANTTTKGNAFRAIKRQRASSGARAARARECPTRW